MPVQVAGVNDRAFRVIASLGLYPDLPEDREAYGARFGRSRWVAFLAATATLLRAQRQLRLHIAMADLPQSERECDHPLSLARVGSRLSCSRQLRSLTAMDYKGFMPGTIHEPGVPDGPRVSVVIPFLNEERALPATLAALTAQDGDFEAVAVDAGSTDASREILAAAGMPVIDARRGRAAQMNAGAAVARGALLLFLHADTVLPPGALRSLTLAASRGPVWGGFRHRFSGDDWRLRFVSRLTNLRCRITGAVYGDQALFASRELFDAAGGFPEEAMEDIALSERLKRLQPPLLFADAVVTDARKFLRMGVWRSLARVALVLACRQLRLPYPNAFFSDIR